MGQRGQAERAEFSEDFRFVTHTVFIDTGHCGNSWRYRRDYSIMLVRGGRTRSHAHTHIAGVVMARVAVQCPGCLAKLNLSDDSKLGKKIKCPKCSDIFVA